MFTNARLFTTDKFTNTRFDNRKRFQNNVVINGLQTYRHNKVDTFFKESNEKILTESNEIKYTLTMIFLLV